MRSNKIFFSNYRSVCTQLVSGQSVIADSFSSASIYFRNKLDNFLYFHTNEIIGTFHHYFDFSLDIIWIECLEYMFLNSFFKIFLISGCINIFNKVCEHSFMYHIYIYKKNYSITEVPRKQYFPSCLTFWKEKSKVNLISSRRDEM